MNHSGFIKENAELRRYARSHLVAAMRDSFYYPTRNFKPGAPAAARAQGRYEIKSAALEREDVRNWMRSRGMQCDGDGIGFGFVWACLEVFGVTHVTLDDFMNKMEHMWAAADRDPSVGREVIHLINHVLRVGEEDSTVYYNEGDDDSRQAEREAGDDIVYRLDEESAGEPGDEWGELEAA